MKWDYLQNLVMEVAIKAFLENRRSTYYTTYTQTHSKT